MLPSGNTRQVSRVPNSLSKNWFMLLIQSSDAAVKSGLMRTFGTFFTQDDTTTLYPATIMIILSSSRLHLSHHLPVGRHKLSAIDTSYDVSLYSGCQSAPVINASQTHGGIQGGKLYVLCICHLYTLQKVNKQRPQTSKIVGVGSSTDNGLTTAKS